MRRGSGSPSLIWSRAPAHFPSFVEARTRADNQWGGRLKTSSGGFGVPLSLDPHRENAMTHSLDTACCRSAASLVFTRTEGRGRASSRREAGTPSQRKEVPTLGRGDDARSATPNQKRRPLLGRITSRRRVATSLVKLPGNLPEQDRADTPSAQGPHHPFRFARSEPTRILPTFGNGEPL
jgi:hypothetical protein